MTVQPGLCQTWSEPQIVGFLMHRLKSNKQTECNSLVVSNVSRFDVNVKNDNLRRNSAEAEGEVMAM